MTTKHDRNHSSSLSGSSSNQRVSKKKQPARSQSQSRSTMETATMETEMELRETKEELARAHARLEALRKYATRLRSEKAKATTSLSEAAVRSRTSEKAPRFQSQFDLYKENERLEDDNARLSNEILLQRAKIAVLTEELDEVKSKSKVGNERHDARKQSSEVVAGRQAIHQLKHTCHEKTVRCRELEDKVQQLAAEVVEWKSVADQLRGEITKFENRSRAADEVLHQYKKYVQRINNEREGDCSEHDELDAFDKRAELSLCQHSSDRTRRTIPASTEASSNMSWRSPVLLSEYGALDSQCADKCEASLRTDSSSKDRNKGSTIGRALQSSRPAKVCVKKARGITRRVRQITQCSPDGNRQVGQERIADPGQVIPNQIEIRPDLDECSLATDFDLHPSSSLGIPAIESLDLQPAAKTRHRRKAKSSVLRP